MKDGKILQLQGCVKHHQSLGVEGALSRTGGLGVLGSLLQSCLCGVVPVKSEYLSQLFRS